jgi:hypothetical protein
LILNYRESHIFSQLRNLCGRGKHLEISNRHISLSFRISLHNIRSLKCKFFLEEESQTPSFHFLCSIPKDHLLICQFGKSYRRETEATNMLKSACNCTPLNLDICQIFETTIMAIHNLILCTLSWEVIQASTGRQDSYMIILVLISLEANRLIYTSF